MHTLLTVIGARPQFIKAGALSRRIQTCEGLREVIVHTGQHYDDNMSDVFFRELNIPKPAYHLAVGGGSHADMTGRMMQQLDPVFDAVKPDACLIYGDTNSTLAGALVAAKRRTPVFHVEAGLRSFNRNMPEELNRVVADHVSDLLFCPTRTSVENLAREGITRGVRQVGDVMQDVAMDTANLLRSMAIAPGLSALAEAPFAVLTVHRAENTASRERLAEVLAFARSAAGGLRIVWPVHPRTRKVVNDLALDTTGFTLVDPLGYFDFQYLLSQCRLVLTDSGGLQKEAYFSRKPCITLRDETEWVETIEAGWNRLWTQAEFRQPRLEVIPEYGDGNASGLILAAITDWFEGTETKGGAN